MKMAELQQQTGEAGGEHFRDVCSTEVFKTWLFRGTVRGVAILLVALYDKNRKEDIFFLFLALFKFKDKILKY